MFGSLRHCTGREREREGQPSVVALAKEREREREREKKRVEGARLVQVWWRFAGTLNGCLHRVPKARWSNCKNGHARPYPKGPLAQTVGSWF